MNNYKNLLILYLNEFDLNYLLKGAKKYKCVNIKKLLKLKCKGIIQPEGSINDNKIINYAIKLKASLYFIKHRVFKH